MVNRSGASSGGWTGGSSQSIYAIPSLNVPSPNPNQGEWIGATQDKKNSKPRYSVKVTHRSKEKISENEADQQPQQLRKSRSGLSLSERLGMDAIKQSSTNHPMPDTAPISQAISHDDAERAGKKGKIKPSNLSLQDRISTDAPARAPAPQSPALKTPLSATHPLPKTPLKHEGKNLKREPGVTPASPSELKMYNANMKIGSIPRGGLMLDAGGGDPVLPQELQTPGKEQFRTNLPADASQDQSPFKKSALPIDQMVAKLRLTQPLPTGGTQESRWAVKSSEEQTTEMADKEAEKLKATNSSIVSPISNYKDRMSASPSFATDDSLFNRNSPPNDTLEKCVKKSEAATKESKEASQKIEGNEKQMDKEATHTTPSLDSNLIASNNDKSQESQTNCGVNGQKLLSKRFPESTSAASLTTDASAETSQAGNDTVTSINWADDDDELPDLPEDWTRASHYADQGEDGSSTMTSSPPPPSNRSLDLVRGSGNEAAEKLDGVFKRGTKRGGKRRTKKDHDESGPHSTTDRIGLKIAGSANRANAPPTRKELFPAYKNETTQSNKDFKSEGEGNNRNDSRPHGRPKLTTGSKDAFDRLTRGAMKSSNSRDSKKGADNTSRLQAGSVAHGSHSKQT